MSTDRTSTDKQPSPAHGNIGGLALKFDRFESHVEEAIRRLPTVLNEEQIKNLKEHKYDTDGTTLLDPLMQKYWDWLVEIVPLWIAPNLLTTIGLAMHVGASILLMLLTNSAKEQCTRWMYFLTGLCLFLYQSLDAIDGKQARRTKSATPLGELFDHGCDSVSTIFITVACCCALQLGLHPWLMFCCCMFSYIAFYCAHWQTYVSGKLRFGKLDCTEAELSFIAVYMITTISPGFWASRVPLINVEFRVIGGLLILGSTAWSAANNIRLTIGQGVTGRKTPSGTSIMVPAWPIAIFIGLGLTAATNSKLNILESHPTLFLVCYGLVFSKITNRLIVAHMSKSPLNVWDSIYISSIVFCINQLLGCWFGEHIFLWSCLIFNLYDLLRYDSKVCQELCDAFDVYCFQLKYLPTAASGQLK